MNNSIGFGVAILYVYGNGSNAIKLQNYVWTSSQSIEKKEAVKREYKHYKNLLCNGGPFKEKNNYKKYVKKIYVANGNAEL